MIGGILRRKWLVTGKLITEPHAEAQRQHNNNHNQ